MFFSWQIVLDDYLHTLICNSLAQDLEKLNRDPSHVIYLGGHAKESTLQPENALSVKPWKLESDDTVLLDLLPFLECMQHLSTLLPANQLFQSGPSLCFFLFDFSA